MKKSLLFVLTAILFFSCLPAADAAFRLRPSNQLGSQNMDEPGDEGSRSTIGIGLQGLFSSGRLDYWAQINGDSYWEAPDEKLSAPTQRRGLSIGGRYNDLFQLWKASFSPFLSLGYANWNKNIPPGPHIGRFEEIMFLSATGGVKASLGRFFLEAGLNCPFWSDTDKGHDLSGKLGYNVFLGISTRIADVGLFHDSTAFGGDGNQSDFRFSVTGLRVIFNFDF